MNKKAFLLYSKYGTNDEFRIHLNNVFCLHMIYQLEKFFPEFDIILYGIDNSYQWLKIHDSNIKMVNVKSKEPGSFLDRCYMFFNDEVKKYDYIVNIDNDLEFINIQKLKQIFDDNVDTFNGRIYTNGLKLKCILATINIANIRKINDILSIEKTQELIKKYLNLCKAHKQHIYAFNNEERVFADMFPNANSISSFNNIVVHYPYDNKLITKKRLFFKIIQNKDFEKFLDEHNLMDIYNNFKTKVLNVINKK